MLSPSSQAAPALGRSVARIWPLLRPHRRRLVAGGACVVVYVACWPLLALLAGRLIPAIGAGDLRLGAGGGLHRMGEALHGQPVAIGGGALQTLAIQAQVHAGQQLLVLIRAAGEQGGPQTLTRASAWKRIGVPLWAKGRSG